MAGVKRYSANGLAGCVSQRRSRKTGFLVGVYHAGQSGMETDPETPWASVCEEHGTLVCHRSLKLARDHAAEPEGWCEDCRRGYLWDTISARYVFMGEDGEPRMVATRPEGTIFQSDDPIRECRNICGRDIMHFDFMRLTAEEIERERMRKLGLG